jgi:hypothetical protein
VLLVSFKDEVDDQANVDDILSNGVTVFDNVSSTEICPGMDLIPLCPKKWFVPYTLQRLKDELLVYWLFFVKKLMLQLLVFLHS